MKTTLLGLLLMLATANFCAAQAPTKTTQVPTKAEQEVLDLSRTKWLWMADKKLDTLNNLFLDQSYFVHMSGKSDKARELEVIRTGSIWYKKAEIYSASVTIFGNTAILFNDIDLIAVVGGNEVVNPFMVTEVYLKENGKWRMGSLTFSHLRRPVKLTINK